MTPLALAPLALLLALPALGQELVPDKSIEIELKASDPVLEGHGPSRTFEYDVTFDGTLYVWAASKDFDPLLRASAADGALIAEDDDSGGGTTAYLALAVSRNEPVSVTLTSKATDAGGRCTLHASEAPETEVSRLTAARIVEACSDAERARKEGQLESARQLTSESLAEAVGYEEARRSATFADAVERLAHTAVELEHTSAALPAWKTVLEFRERVLPPDHADLQHAREDLATTLHVLGELRGARELYLQAIESRARTLPADHPRLQRAKLEFAFFLSETGDLQGARELEEEIVAIRSRTLPEDHPDLLTAQMYLGVTLEMLGDLDAARELEQKVLDLQSRSLPDDHPRQQSIRQNLAVTLKRLGDLHGARALEEKVLEVRARTVPADHRDLQIARHNLAVTLRELGELQRARELEQQVLEVHARILPEDHPALLMEQEHFALLLEKMGDIRGALEIEERVLEIESRFLAPDHPSLVGSKMNLAGMLHQLGRIHDARRLFEQVVEACERTLPEDHLDLQAARTCLAVSLSELGDLHGARALKERVLEVYARVLPDDHPDLQAARQNLGTALIDLGDMYGARELFEQVLEVRSRTLPGDHPELQAARLNLASVLLQLGEIVGARDLQEQAVEAYANVFPGDHPELLASKQGLAVTLQQMGELERARVLEVEVLAMRSRSLPADHPDVQTAKQNLAITLRLLGDLPGALELQQDALRMLEAALPSDHPDLLSLRANLAHMLARVDRERALHQAGEIVSALRRTVAETLGRLSPREFEALLSEGRPHLSIVLSLTPGGGGFEPSPTLERDAFALLEASRSVALRGATVERTLARERQGELARLREAEVLRSAELSRLASSGGSRDALAAVRRELDLLRRQRMGKIAGTEIEGLMIEPTAEALSSSLEEGQAIVSYHRYQRWEFVADERPTEAATDSLFAYVLSRKGRLLRVELGPLSTIEEAVRRWRDELGVDSHTTSRGVPPAGSGTTTSSETQGEELRRLVLDPVLAAVGDTRHLVLALDDLLHAIPLDALPLGASLVGERRVFELRPALWQRLVADRDLPEGRGLVVLGNADYDADPASTPALMPASAERDEAPSSGFPAQRGATRSVLPVGANRARFVSLPATREEALGIARLHAQAFEGLAVRELEGAEASRGVFLVEAPEARFLHLATHGWFASDSILSASEVGQSAGKLGSAQALTAAEQVSGTSPMLLCGLAFAGANREQDESLYVGGTLTAEEIASLDISTCELAVLSACDTNVGIRRAGQGVASLQKALHMAGARSVITSLWKVPDEATKELMLDFYRRLWVEKKPKWRALWEAKMKLRNAKDANGDPLYTTRDWAAWVLTGEPD